MWETPATLWKRNRGVAAVENENMEKQRSLIVKIIIPVLIVALIGGMWLVKNQKEQADVTDDNTPPKSPQIIT